MASRSPNGTCAWPMCRRSSNADRPNARRRPNVCHIGKPTLDTLAPRVPSDATKSLAGSRIPGLPARRHVYVRRGRSDAGRQHPCRLYGRSKSSSARRRR
jgi:hypothetical protein